MGPVLTDSLVTCDFAKVLSGSPNIPVPQHSAYAVSRWGNTLKEHQVNLLCCQSLLLLWSWHWIWKFVQTLCAQLCMSPRFSLFLHWAVSILRPLCRCREGEWTWVKGRHLELRLCRRLARHCSVIWHVFSLGNLERESSNTSFNRPLPLSGVSNLKWGVGTVWKVLETQHFPLLHCLPDIFSFSLHLHPACLQSWSHLALIPISFVSSQVPLPHRSFCLMIFSATTRFCCCLFF